MRSGPVLSSRPGPQRESRDVICTFWYYCSNSRSQSPGTFLCGHCGQGAVRPTLDKERRAQESKSCQQLQSPLPARHTQEPNPVGLGVNQWESLHRGSKRSSSQTSPGSGRALVRLPQLRSKATKLTPAGGRRGALAAAPEEAAVTVDLSEFRFD